MEARAPKPNPNWGGGLSFSPSSSFLPLLVGVPFLFEESERGKEVEEREERGAAPSPSPIWFGLGGCVPPPGRCLLSSTKAHEGPLILRGVPVTSQYSGKCPNLFETFPVSEHNLPINQSLCLDHFETPRHVRDLIRDSEQTSVIENT